ncbi:hypothetical protein K466DRAFT_652820 [Polyporus arcularius HHB13444]|uniref:Uncharacterized protein n=1 Tax=Polyporus arcularius HHB13444 TaxID=1314778 RepID=A0A5C3PFL9_9APHY|nr:hypothetical protein K466DRAFT_652820 [Polyporus arcularius HHB13444]
MGGKQRTHTRDDVHSRPSRLPVTLYTECQNPARSMQALMGLAHDKEKMRRYVDTMSVCASRHLDASKSFMQQPKETMTRYLRSVSKHIDIMDAYEDAWPATTYARLWLERSHFAQRRRARRKDAPVQRTKSAPDPANTAPRKGGASLPKIKRSHTKREEDKENDEPSSMPSVPENIPEVSSQSTMGTVSSTDATQFTQATANSTRSSQSRPLCLRNSQSAPPPNQCQRPSQALRRQREGQTPSSSSSTTLSTSGKFVSHVATFLHSLAQPLDHLLPVFYAAGLRDADSLRGLARLRDRGEWLYVLVVDRKITPLEYKFIVDGLDDLVEAKQE